MTEALIRSLHEPRRNKYFYGKLLDVSHFQMEQCYGIDKRWLLNRLGLGAGVLCGLGVTAGADGTVCISPGVAIDGWGREIIVPAPSIPVAPDQPTDAKGIARGDKLTSGDSTIYLCYAECDAEPTAVYVSECDGVATNAASTTVERYRIIVRPGLPGSEPAELTSSQRDAIYPAEPQADFDRRIATEQTLAIDCARPADPCVVLATVTLPANGKALQIDPYTYRAEVFSNTVLFELIAALADRVDACCASVHPEPQQSIAVEDGDNQVAEVGAELAAPVRLLVADAGGNPVANADVKLATTDADAALSVGGAAFAPSLDTTSQADGTIDVAWRLGSAAGAAQFTATLVQGGASVTAHATAHEAPAAHPPVVVRIAPPNAAQEPLDWLKEPLITVAFDRDMDPAGLAEPDRWLRAWAFPRNADGILGKGRRIKLAPGEPPEGSVSKFRAEPINLDRATIIVMMAGSVPEIVAAGTALALDAEYRGTQLAPQQLDALWDADDFAPDHNFSLAVRDSGAQLPSGDGTPGGRYFNSFFTAAPGH
jgi:hypothetical protein